MTTLTITIDEATEADLQRLSAREGQQAGEYAARLLARAVRAARPRPVFANSDGAHRAGLLALEERE